MKKIKNLAVKFVAAISLLFVWSIWAGASVTESLSDTDTVSVEVSTLSTEAEDSLDFAKFQAAEYDMLCLVAHFEGVKVNAYWDPHGRIWTIGIGNTVRPNGTKVARGDRIKDKDELFEYFKAHVEAYIWPDMQRYLPISKMSVQEIAALGSLFYNCGSGILKNKDDSPSVLAKAICGCYDDSVKESNQKEVVRLMNAKVYAKGKKLDVLVKRRLLEEKIFLGEIIMDNKGEFALENSVNFAEQPLGAAYGIPVKDFNDISLVCDSINSCPYGRNLEDSIEYAFTHPRKVVYKKTVRRRIRR